MSKYSMESTLGELVVETAVKEMLSKFNPGFLDSLAFQYAASARICDMNTQITPDKQALFTAAVDVANGKEIDWQALQTAMSKICISTFGAPTYDIDDVDGQLFMLERRFSGCVILRFSKNMDDKAHGRVTCNGQELPVGYFKTIKEAGNVQMYGIPVRSVFTDYDKEYTLLLKGFSATDGTVMEPTEVVIKTLPKSISDPTYAEHDSVALQVAREGIVLLKNEDNVLPLQKKEAIHMVGAEDFRIGAAGAGRITPRYSMRLQRAVEECSDFVLSTDASTGIFVISRASGENLDNAPCKGEYFLTDAEEVTLKEFIAAHSKTVVILSSGYPMDVRWADTLGVNALVWCGFSGMLGGTAVVEILDGRVCPSGKLPDTWSLDYYDIPASANFINAEGLPADLPYFADTYYEEDIYVGYRYFETFNKPVAYSFGFGLSYTTFSLNTAVEGLNVTTTVTNTGRVPGAEVVQVYATVPEGRLEQPIKRLVGFAKTKALVPGESQELTVSIERKLLASYDSSSTSWIMEPGRYDFLVGNSVQNVKSVGGFTLKQEEIIRKVAGYMKSPVDINTLSKKMPSFPKGEHTRFKKEAISLEPLAPRKRFIEHAGPNDVVSEMSVEELVRISVCASHGWGMHNRGEAGSVFKLEKYNLPDYIVADGNNGVNIKKPNIGMPCSNTVCATFNTKLAYQVGKVIAEEAKENGMQMILAPGMNIHRNPLNGRHPEYFSEDPLLTGIMAGNQSKGLEENGVSSCIKHTIGNNCETVRKRNHSMIPDRALYEIYLRAFELAIDTHKPDGIMTGYNAVNGAFTAEDEEMILEIFRKEFGFEGYVMTDWSSYDSIDIVKAVAAGNCWITPGSTDDTFTTPLIEGVKSGAIEEERLRSNVRNILRVVQKRTGADIGVL